MSLDPHPLALVAAGELAKRHAEGAGCAYLALRDLAKLTGHGRADLLRLMADAIDAGRLRVDVVEISEPER